MEEQNERAYSPDLYLSPLWKGNTVYYETVMFVGEEAAPLLYFPEQILSVTSFDLETEYRQGEDYLVRDGKLVRLPEGKIPVFTEEEFYPEQPTEIRKLISSVPGHQYLLFCDDKTLWHHQIHVTYTHKDKWSGFLPQKQDKFNDFLKKAASGEPVKVLFYGDSITTGVCSSKAIGEKPYADTWCDLVIYGLRRYFDNSNITSVNTAVGGKRVAWGLEQVRERAIDQTPDLMFLGFGMNEWENTLEAFVRDTKEIIDRFLAVHPSAAIALVATMLPHFRAAEYYRGQWEQEPYLIKLAEEYPNVGVVPMTSVHRTVLEKKRYFDMTGNNINHPNDFLARLYAQTALTVLLGEDFEKTKAD